MGKIIDKITDFCVFIHSLFNFPPTWALRREKRRKEKLKKEQWEKFKRAERGDEV